ncbi:MAG: hypothetical protein KDA52_23310, partial [Planctomycetaceae bacterium]|nr:hypothetical protein [Planctomycetaceae bacterium]
MNTSIICLMVAAAGVLPDAPQQTVYRPSQDFSASLSLDDAPPIVVRAQSSPFYGSGGTPQTYAPGTVTQQVQPYPGTTLPPTYQP